MSLRDVTLVGHSMGGAVALRYAARFRSRVAKLVVAEAAAPRFVFGPHSADLAAGLDGLISGYAQDRSQVVRALTKTFFSTHTDVTTDPFLQFFERQGLDQASLQASRAGLIALRDTDLTPDLARISDTDAGLPRPARPDRAVRPRAGRGCGHRQRPAGHVHHRRARALHRRAGEVPRASCSPSPADGGASCRRRCSRASRAQSRQPQVTPDQALCCEGSEPRATAFTTTLETP